MESSQDGCQRGDLVGPVLPKWFREKFRHQQYRSDSRHLVPPREIRLSEDVADRITQGLARCGGIDQHIRVESIHGPTNLSAIGPGSTDIFDEFICPLRRDAAIVRWQGECPSGADQFLHIRSSCKGLIGSSCPEQVRSDDHGNCLAVSCQRDLLTPFYRVEKTMQFGPCRTHTHGGHANNCIEMYMIVQIACWANCSLLSPLRWSRLGLSPLRWSLSL